MDGWMDHTRLAKHSICREDEVKAGSMNHDVYTSHRTLRVTGAMEEHETKEVEGSEGNASENPSETSNQHEADHDSQESARQGKLRKATATAVNKTPRKGAQCAHQACVP
jgi:hypothetical protein